VLSLRAKDPPNEETWTWKRGPGIRNRRDGAPRGARALEKRVRQDGRLVRRSVLYPLGLFEGEQGGIRRTRRRQEYGR